MVDVAELHGVSLLPFLQRTDDVVLAHVKLIRKLSENGKIQISFLVDEYDSPIVSALENLSLPEEKRKQIANVGRRVTSLLSGDDGGGSDV